MKESNLKPENPIGIFDSGVGGLTVAYAIKKALPNEKIIYFGDLAHLPYGEKSPEAIKSYAKDIVDFLLKKNCKCIVIACNSASAVAAKTVAKQIKNKAILVTVIEPTANYVATHYNKKEVGVIGTKATINSCIYPNTIRKINPTVKVKTKATPLLVPIIEEGFKNSIISKEALSVYLSSNELKNIKAIVLGCTHYPIIKSQIKEYYGSGIEVIDSAKLVASELKKLLTKKYLLNLKSKNPKHEFFVSDYTSVFEKTARIFFHSAIKLKQIKL